MIVGKIEMSDYKPAKRRIEVSVGESVHGATHDAPPFLDMDTFNTALGI
jgi:hypothetical protein